MTVSAIGDVAAELTTLALNGTRFDVVLKEKDGDDWSFRSVVLAQLRDHERSPEHGHDLRRPLGDVLRLQPRRDRTEDRRVRDIP